MYEVTLIKNDNLICHIKWNKWFTFMLNKLNKRSCNNIQLHLLRFFCTVSSFASYTAAFLVTRPSTHRSMVVLVLFYNSEFKLFYTTKRQQNVFRFSWIYATITSVFLSKFNPCANISRSIFAYNMWNGNGRFSLSKSIKWFYFGNGKRYICRPNLER